MYDLSRAASQLLLATSITLCSAGGMAAECTNEGYKNVLYEQPVWLVGTFGVTSTLPPGGSYTSSFSTPLPAASSLTDDAYFSEKHPWSQDTIWWDARVAESSNNEIIITLDRIYLIIQLKIQADNNDIYTLYYLDENDTWQSAWEAGPTNQWGVTKRNSIDSVPPFATDRIKIIASGGDYQYSVSEIYGRGIAYDCD
ncbi:hypothetical protein [uncultured Microbulbifer sp.]|uniref:hypothetical protein n=1 Tax=uncultured Microbulbifer sp. TaxID=348147 RepID=UPI002620E8FE|nr:hypothetical protein [uncultured Microbulbifer sp.]